MSIRNWTLGFVGTVAALLAGVAQAQDRKPVELRYTTGAPAKTPWVMQLQRFEKDVEEETKGAIRIASFISAQLGNEQDTVQQVARGRIDMGGFSNGAVALIVPELALLGLPFYFKDTAEQDCVIDGHMTRPVREMLAMKGIKFLGWTEVGTGDIAGKRPFLVPSDVKGLKAASASNKVSAAMWVALGANPTPIGITEITSAFQTGLVDINATVVTFYLPSGLAKAAPVLSRVELADAPGIILMNKNAYDRLPADQRAMLDKAVARRSATQLRIEIRGFEQTLRDMHVKTGGQIAAVSPAQREEWRKVLEPAWPKMVKDVGGDAEKFFALMEAGKKACAGKT
jgi:TRAP-type C4-dicarboxylate transport system substrate-binding protein